MGWFGYGMHDGDGTTTTQMALVKESGFEKNTPLKNGGILDDIWQWDFENEQLANQVVQAVFEKWEKIEKKVILNNKNKYWNEDLAISYTMAADFFMLHKAPMPDGLLEKAKTATQYLIKEGHCDDFNEPMQRKSVLKDFFKNLEKYKPKMSYELVSSNKKKI